MTCVGHRLSSRQAKRFTHLLTSLDIDHRSEPAGRKVDVWVPAAYAPFARRHLARQAAEASLDGIDPDPEALLSAGWSSLIAVLALALLYLLITLEADAQRFFEVYGAVDRKIRTGEIYRCVTALLFHTTPAHLLGNITALLLFAPIICQRFGHGWGWLLVLASGVGGNYLNAWVRVTPQLITRIHLSVGASTAVFGALGILVAVNMRRRDRYGGNRWRVWTPVAGGLGFLAFMGSAPGSDLLAHLFGLLVGGTIGLVALYGGQRPAGGWWQATAAAATLGTLAWAWVQGLGPA
jgi:membrane associated rhomboid family serine protease